MSRLEKKCFIGSATFHGVLLLVFLFGSAFLNSPNKQQQMTVVTIFATPTDRKISTGGSPNGTPTPPAPKSQVAPETPKPEPPKPEPPKPEPPKPQPVVQKQPDPVVHKPEVVKPRETPKVVKVPEKEAPKQQGDFVVKPPKKTKTPEKEVDSEPKRQVSLKTVKRTFDPGREEREKQERLQREAYEKAKEKAQKEWQEQVADFNRKQTALNSQLKGLVDGVGKDLGKTTVVTPLGDGGVAFVQYGPLIREIYDRAWVEPPSLVDDDGTVKAKIVIARNGRVISASIIGRSGTPTLDKSVQRALDSVKLVPPFPPESSDNERSFTINFNLKAKRMTT